MSGRRDASRRRSHRRGRHEPGRNADRSLRSGAHRGRVFPAGFEGTWAEYLGTDEGPAFYMTPEDPDR